MESVKSARRTAQIRPFVSIIDNTPDFIRSWIISHVGWITEPRILAYFDVPFYGSGFSIDYIKIIGQKHSKCDTASRGVIFPIGVNRIGKIEQRILVSIRNLCMEHEIFHRPEGLSPHHNQNPDSFNPNRSLDFGEIARLCHAACFSPSRRRSGLRRGRTEAGKMPECLIFLIRNGLGMSNDRFGFNPGTVIDNGAFRSDQFRPHDRSIG